MSTTGTVRTRVRYDSQGREIRGKYIYCRECSKELTEHNWSVQRENNFFRLRDRCRACMVAYVVRMEQKRRSQGEDSRTRKRTQYVSSLKAGKQCMDCGERHTDVLQFHHRNPKEKLFAIAQWSTSGYTFDALHTEIAKCDLLCANCHVRHHADDRAIQREFQTLRTQIDTVEEYYDYLTHEAYTYFATI